MRNTVNKIGIGAMVAATAIMFSTPAVARNNHGGGYYESGYDGYYEGRQDYRNGRDYRDYRNDRNYRGNRCSKGTGGTIIGAIAGGLLGNAVVGRRGDKTTGVIIGAGAGALAGRAIDRSSGRRC
jgi:Glycine zipper 2TM domain